MNIALAGRIIPEEEAVISAYDHGFLYGIGLFETFRTYGGEPFLLDRHLARLAEGCEALGIRHRTDEAEVRQLLSRLLAANGLRDAYFRYTVTGGPGTLGLSGEDYASPTVAIYVKTLPGDGATPVGHGSKVLRLLRLRRNTPEGVVRYKSLHYMNSVLGKRELSGLAQSPDEEGMMLDARGHLAEGLVSNVFYVKEGEVFTPAIDVGILPGVTRAFVMECCERQGITLREGLFRWEDLWQADEVFVTNSIQSIVPVRSLFDAEGRERQLPGAGTAGALTRKLSEIYQDALPEGWKRT